MGVKHLFSTYHVIHTEVTAFSTRDIDRGLIVAERCISRPCAVVTKTTVNPIW